MVCSACLAQVTRSCCFCGARDADLLCPKCEPHQCRAFHLKCILQGTDAGASQTDWRCLECRQSLAASHEPITSKEISEESQVPESADAAMPPEPPREPVDSRQEADADQEKQEQKSGPVTLDKVSPEGGVTDSLQNRSGTRPEIPCPLIASHMSHRKPETWSVADVVSFIESTGFEDEALIFKEQEIDGKSLLLMKRSDVITGLKLKVGPALKIFSFINHLQIFKLVSKGHLTRDSC